MLIYQLTRPFAYLKIEHPEKWKFDWLVPLVLNIITLFLFYFIGNGINIFGNNGFIDLISRFVQILPGFYIAALAAIATFNRTNIDQYMPEPTPKMDILISGQKNTISLTRRRFLCMLFSFLTAESIFLSLTSIFSLLFAPSISITIPMMFHELTIYFFIFFYTFLFWQMIVATFLGLYYLGDRLNQPDQKT